VVCSEGETPLVLELANALLLLSLGVSSEGLLDKVDVVVVLATGIDIAADTTTLFATRQVVRCSISTRRDGQSACVKAEEQGSTRLQDGNTLCVVAFLCDVQGRLIVVGTNSEDRRAILRGLATEKNFEHAMISLSCSHMKCGLAAVINGFFQVETTNNQYCMCTLDFSTRCLETYKRSRHERE
jgi:hypothetical protein